MRRGSRHDRQPLRGPPRAGRRRLRPDATERACPGVERARFAHHGTLRPPRARDGHHRGGRPTGRRSRDRRLQGDGPGRRRSAPRRSPLRGDDHDRPERARRRGCRTSARSVAARLGDHVHEWDAPLGYRGRVRARHADLARAVRRRRRGRRRRGRGAHRLGRPGGRGVRRPPARTVGKARLQRDGERRRRADRPPARLPLRRGERPFRPGNAGPRARAGGRRGRDGRRCVAARGPLGDERARDEPRERPPSLDARGRGGPAADGGRHTINGALVREAEQRGVEIPLQQALHALVRGREASYR